VIDSLDQLGDWLGPLIERLTPAQRRRAAVEIGRELRRSQVQRIGAQLAPDGSAYEPRKPPRLRERAGAIRRGAMFSKIKKARYLKTEATADAAAVGFAGSVARIAAVHQFGQLDRPEPKGPEVRYPERQLLGFSPADRELIETILTRHLGL